MKARSNSTPSLREAVQLRRRRARVAVGAELARARRVEDHEEYARVRRGPAAAGRPAAPPRERTARQPATAPRAPPGSAAPARSPRRSGRRRRRPRAARGGRSSLARRAATARLRAARSRPSSTRDHSSRSSPARVSSVTRNATALADGARRRMQQGREAQLGRFRQAQRVADDAGPDLGERGRAFGRVRRERMRGVTPQQVVQGGLGRRPDRQAVERRRQLAPVAARRVQCPPARRCARTRSAAGCHRHAAPRRAA